MTADSPGPEGPAARDRRRISSTRLEAPGARRAPPELSAKHYLSQPEQLEESTLKKRKLQIKDRMEDILRRRRQQSAAPAMSGLDRS